MIGYICVYLGDPTYQIDKSIPCKLFNPKYKQNNNHGRILYSVILLNQHEKINLYHYISIL